jgi:RNA polymerase sigma-70 factor, ECF subfamily
MNELPDEALRHEQFMRLFVQHEPQILRAIMVLVPQVADARDVLQETSVVLWQQFSAYDPQRPFVNWALGYARNFIRRHFRAVERGRRLSDTAVEALLIAAEPREALVEQRADALAVCLRDLPPEGRQILEGYYFRQQTVQELGQRHSKSAEAIYKIIQRLRLALLDCINKRLAGSSPI